MSQLSICRKQFETEELLKLEFKVIKAIISKYDCKQGGFAMALGTRLTIDGTEHVYLRWIEEGVLIGIGDRFMNAKDDTIETIRDSIMTHSDSMRMTTFHKAKQKPEDIKCSEKLHKSFVLSNSNVYFSLFCNVDKNNAISLHTKGFGEFNVNINDIVNLLVKQPLAQEQMKKSNLSCLLADLDNSTVIPFQHQLNLMNMIPAQFTTSRSDPNSLKLPMHIAWQRLAPKHTIIHHSHNIKLIDSSFSNTLSTCHEPKERSCSKGNIRKPKQKDDLQKFLKRFSKRFSTNHEEFICSQGLTSQKYTPDISTLEIFQKQMPVIGHLRVTKLEHKTITVLWNKFDSLSSKIFAGFALVCDFIDLPCNSREYIYLACICFYKQES